MIWNRNDIGRTIFGRRMFWILVLALVIGKILSALTGSAWPFWVLLVMGGIPLLFDIFKWIREMTVRDFQRCGHPRSGDQAQSISSPTIKGVDTHEHD